MFFNSFLYIIFLGVSVGIFWLLPGRFRFKVLVGCSLVYYAFASFAYLLLIIFLAVFVFIAGKKISRIENNNEKKKWLIGSLLVVILVLVWFKYSTLFFGGIASLLGFQMSGLNILLPLGISFFTFEFIHYLIEIYFGHVAIHTAEEFFSFAFFFPTLASGPIKRFQTFIISLREHIFFSKPYFFTGILYIIGGYAQKNLIADNLVTRTAFLSTPAIAPTSSALLSGLFLYSIRLYFDFAGLSNIAIGSALLFGIKVPINFHWPFFQRDLAAFWRSWHMSLTSWIRDYVYMPLVFHFRNSKGAIILGLVLTMSVVGLWHGSSWNFLVFGIYHGIGLAFLQIMRSFQRKKILPYRFGYVLGMLITFVYVSFGWGFFVTNSLADSILLYSRIFAKII
jgi:alginate O-acetyltransferase complex protein AlgI